MNVISKHSNAKCTGGDDKMSQNLYTPKLMQQEYCVLSS